MMIGVREIRLSGNPAELQAAQDYLEVRHKAALNSIDETFKLSKSPENRVRIEKMKAGADDYVNRTAREIITLQKEVVAIEVKRSPNGELAPDLEARLIKLRGEEAHFARDIGLPIAKELEELGAKVSAFPKHRVEQETAVAQQEMSSSERTSLVIGLVAGLVM